MNGGSWNVRLGAQMPCGVHSLGFCLLWLLPEGEMSARRTRLRKMPPASLWKEGTGPLLSSQLLSRRLLCGLASG